MQNLKNDGMQKVTLWQQRDEAQVQVQAKFAGNLGHQRHKHGQFSTMMFPTLITSRTQHLLPADYIS
jgi:hypothetical protein